MIRTQIQLTEEQARALKALAAARHVSVAELIRQSVDDRFEKLPASTWPKDDVGLSPQQSAFVPAGLTYRRTTTTI